MITSATPTQFAASIDLLTARHAALADEPGAGSLAESTVVFDAGQNPVANFTHLTGTGLAFVGSIPPWTAPTYRRCRPPTAAWSTPTDSAL